MSPSYALRRLRRAIVPLLMMSLVALLAACGGGGGGGADTIGSSNPPPQPLSIQPNSATLGAGTTLQFTTVGGKPPYSFTLASAAGSIDSAGLFTAPASPTSNTVRVTDAAGVSATASVTINPTLAMNAASITLTASSGHSFQFAGTGGSGSGYQYSLVSGTGTITADGLYTVGNFTGRDTVQVRDAQGTTASSTVNVFRVRTNGAVNTIATSGAAIYLGGAFTAVNPYLTPGMAVLDPTSGKPQLQCDLSSGFDAPVRKVLVVNDALYVAGDFSTYQGRPAQGLAKLDARTCTLDTAFTQSVGFAGTSFATSGDFVAPFQSVGVPSVVTMATSGNSLWVAGSFTSYRGLPARNLAKLDLKTGALDTTFTAATGPDGPLWSLAISADSVYVLGRFAHYRSTAVAYGVPVKLDIASGAMDPTFHPPIGLDDSVTAVLCYGTSLYVADTIRPSSGVLQATVLKLDGATGAQDTTFAPPPAMGVSPFTPQIDYMLSAGQSLYLSGEFTMGTGRTNLVKLDVSTGQLDSAFNQVPTLDYSVYAFEVSGSSLYLVSGLQARDPLTGLSIVKVDATTGAIDSAFGLKPAFGGVPLTIAAGQNTVYVGGALSGYGGSPAVNIAKLDGASGVADAGFDSAAKTDGAVNKLLTSGSALYIGGAFFSYGGMPAAGIAKVDSNTGVPDARFGQSGGFGLIPYGANFPGYSPSVHSMVLNGSSLYVGGLFTSYGGQPAADLAKLDAATGDLDQTFTDARGFYPAGPTGSVNYPNVNALAITQNALYVAGDFSQYRGASVAPVVKLDLATGAADMAFVPPVGARVWTSPMALAASDSNLYVGVVGADVGGGVGSTGLCKLNATTGAVDSAFTQALALQPRYAMPGAVPVVSDLAISGASVYVAGDFAVGSGAPAVVNLIKVDASSGALDTTFSAANGVNGAVNSVLLNAGSLYIGGSFSNYRQASAPYSAALDPATGLNQDAAPSQ